jgi:hypothetical protein
MADTGVGVQVNIDAVKAAEDIVSAAAAGVEGAERSCVIEVDNQLPVRLTFDLSDHDHGGFGTILPKGVIEPMGFDVFNSRSSGFLTGTEGHIFYRFNGHKLFVHWDNPFSGNNSSDGHVEPDDPRYRVIAITGNGNHGAHMRFIIAETTQPHPIAHILQTFPTSPSFAVSRTPDRMDLFWVHPDGSINATFWDGAFDGRRVIAITDPGKAQPGH